MHLYAAGLFSKPETLYVQFNERQITGDFMTQSLHSQACTTHLIREDIRTSTLSQAELAQRYNVTRQTIRRWQDRDSPDDRPPL